MKIDFFEANCQQSSDEKLFGICDDQPPPHLPAYLDETNGGKWIAVVVNEYKQNVKFTAIDHCIETKDLRGKMIKRCDGVLSYDSTVVFVELKERKGDDSVWSKDGVKQLLSTIKYFEATEQAKDFQIKKAYLANGERPKFRDSQIGRMEDFLKETGYTLRIERRITLD